MKINEIITHKKLGEQATAGATSAGNIATLSQPTRCGRSRQIQEIIHRITWTFGNESTQRAKTQDAEAHRQRNTDAGTSLFGGPAIKRNMY